MCPPARFGGSPRAVLWKLFRKNDTAQAALLYHLMIIGEAVNNLPGALLERYPEVPWHAVVALRNRVIHGYFGIDWTLIWETVTAGVPGLRETIARILWDEFGTVPPEV